MKWQIVTFDQPGCEVHKWAHRALAVPLENGEAVILAEACQRCGHCRVARKAGSGALGAGSRARASHG